MFLSETLTTFSKSAGASLYNNFIIAVVIPSGPGADAGREEITLPSSPIVTSSKSAEPRVRRLVGGILDANRSCRSLAIFSRKSTISSGVRTSEGAFREGAHDFLDLINLNNAFLRCGSDRAENRPMLKDSFARNTVRLKVAR